MKRGTLVVFLRRMLRKVLPTLLFLLSLFTVATSLGYYNLSAFWKASTSTPKGWTWVGGANLVSQENAFYGTQGVGSTNNSPGAREHATTWKDAAGNFWLFGGDGDDGSGSYGTLGDLWEYTPGNNKWTWVSGTNQTYLNGNYGTQGLGSTSNYPGSRNGAYAWVDGSGIFWIFGGYGSDANGQQGDLNDFWEFNPANLQWTWVSGSNLIADQGNYGTQGVGSTSNLPPSRDNGPYWKDASGNFWLFGGEVQVNPWDFDDANDLWEYNPTNQQWTWVSGTNTAGQLPAYGTQGVGSTSNYPGARDSLSAWVDSSGNFWLFGGNGYDSAGTFDLLSDLWEFNPSNLQWTWVTGSTTAGHRGVFGVQGVGDPTNTPGGRAGGSAWTDSSGNLFLFGGFGYDDSGIPCELNDLWENIPSNPQWIWIGGNTPGCQPGVYGTQGVGSTSNVPGGRTQSARWIDASGNFWIYGGNAYDSASFGGDMNDLWKYNPGTQQWTWVSGANRIISVPNYGTQGTGSTLNFPGGRTQSTTWTDSSNNLWLFGGVGNDATGTFGGLNDIWEYTPVNKKWAWIAGSNTVYPNSVYGTEGTGSTSNAPGYRNRAAAGHDASGNFWIFGGQGYDSTQTAGILNDLWEFNPSNLQWTWVGGSIVRGGSPTYGTKGTGSTSNIPGARNDTGYVTDASGKLWVFGGSGVDSNGSTGSLNDLWEFDPATLQWTWVSGDTVIAQAGVYGLQNTGSTSNKPGGRAYCQMWMDAAGNIWIFGGQGFDSASTSGYLNDLWKFEPTTLKWTWVSGSNVINQYGTYGTLGTPNSANVPGARFLGTSSMDASGNLLVFGGLGWDSGSGSGTLNDLWSFNPTTQKWTWLAGSNIVNAIGSYGTLGVSNPANSPGARIGVVAWSIPSGIFWLFGGQGYDAGGAFGCLNDLWKFQ